MVVTAGFGSAPRIDPVTVDELTEPSYGAALRRVESGFVSD